MSVVVIVHHREINLNRVNGHTVNILAYMDTNRAAFANRLAIGLYLHLVALGSMKSLARFILTSTVALRPEQVDVGS